jgi:hypothetical protein
MRENSLTAGARTTAGSEGFFELLILLFFY